MSTCPLGTYPVTWIRGKMHQKFKTLHYNTKIEKNAEEAHFTLRPSLSGAGLPLVIPYPLSAPYIQMLATSVPTSTSWRRKHLRQIFNKARHIMVSSLRHAAAGAHARPSSAPNDVNIRSTWWRHHSRSDDVTRDDVTPIRHTRLRCDDVADISLCPGQGNRLCPSSPLPLQQLQQSQFNTTTTTVLDWY